MKTVDIITAEMHQLHGANKVTEKLILGQKYFEKNGFRLRYIISQDGIIECDKYVTSTLGCNLNKKSYKQKRTIIELLKKLPIYNVYLVQRRLVKQEFINNQKVLENMKLITSKADIVIFQDPYTAIYYLRKTGESPNSIFISHADKDPLEHLLIGRPSLKNTYAEKKIREEYEYLFRTVNAVVTICKSSKKYMKDNYGIDAPCIINGIEDVTISDKTKLSISDGKIHIAIVASIQYRKGQDIAIDALNKLTSDEKNRIKLHIFGGGYELDNLKRKVEEYALNESVVFYGPVLNVEEYLPKMDAFLLPSRADTVPISIIEAMRAELPIFASDVGEIPEMIDGCGKLVPANINSVHELYRGLLNDEYDLKKIGASSREKFNHEYQLEAMISKYIDVLNMYC